VTDAGPFPVDPVAAARLRDLVPASGEAVAAEVGAIVAARRGDPATAATVPAAAVRDLMARHGLASAAEVALLALPAARSIARPPISGYRVGVVGVEAGSGDLVLGGNLEFPGFDLWATVHAEGFASLRARARGAALATLALTEAHPCAHCRQTLMESAAAGGLVVVDLLGHALPLDRIYPWAFGPAALGERGDVPAGRAWVAAAIVDPAGAMDLDAVTADALTRALVRAHAPYGTAPSAAALRLADGRVLGGGCVESVAFNPTITALQAALVEVVAIGADPSDVVGAWLARVPGSAADPEPAFRGLIHAVAPAAAVHVLDVRFTAG
jgi:cytidine deaminase